MRAEEVQSVSGERRCPEPHARLAWASRWPGDVTVPGGRTLLSARCHSAGDKRHPGQVPPGASGYR